MKFITSIGKFTYLRSHLHICLFAYLLIFGLLICLLKTPSALAAPPSSTNFILDQYGFGAGGVATSSSESYLFQGILGEIETASLSSTNFLGLPGLTYALEPSTPGAPTVTNPSNYYNKLSIIINNANNPSDTTFLIQVASNSATFSQNVSYVQADNTLGEDKIWQTYSAWGSGSGFTLIGLSPSTTYYVRVGAKRGVYQQSIFGPVASASTISPTLTIDIDTTSQTNPPFTVDIGNLTAGSVTTSTDKVTTTISTNATSGGLIYVYGTNNGLLSTTAGNYNITSATADLTSTSEGYGVRGTTTGQGSGGPMELISPYNGSGNNVGIVSTIKRQLADSSQAPVTSGQVSFELKAKASSTTPSANDYTDTVTIIGTGSF